MSSIIRLTRVANYQSFLIKLSLYVDGQKAGKIPDGKTLSFVVKPGKHKVQVREWWFWRSKLIIIEIVEDEILHLECGHYMGWRLTLRLLLGPLSFLWPKGFLWLRIAPKIGVKERQYEPVRP
jgi:hypothetical protein